MPDAILALGLTLLILALLGTWVPLLHLTEALLARHPAREREVEKAPEIFEEAEARPHCVSEAA